MRGVAAAAVVEGVVGRGGAGRGRRRARRRRSRASSGVAAPVEGVVGCGGAGRGRRPPLRGAPTAAGCTAAGCATDDQCTKLHYQPTAAVLASTAGNSSVPCSSGCSTTCMCSTSGQQNQCLFNKLVWLAGQNYLGSLKFLRFPGDADPMSIGLNLGKTEEAPWTRARARVPAIWLIANSRNTQTAK